MPWQDAIAGRAKARPSRVQVGHPYSQKQYYNRHEQVLEVRRSVYNVPFVVKSFVRVLRSFGVTITIGRRLGQALFVDFPIVWEQLIELLRSCAIVCK